MEREPTNRELMHLVTDVQKDVKENLEQAKKTNGRVSSLENWKAFMQGGLAVLTILVIPILLYVITHWK